MQKIKKAILTGGGRATRLRPVTSTMNKHLIPLANKPMIFHAIQKAVDAGIEEIFINTNPGETDLQKHIGDGGHWGIKITFFEQTGGPQGIAHVVNEAKKFIGNDPFMFYLSDNILLGSLKTLFDEFTDNSYDAMFAFSHVVDPQRFGVPIFNEQGKLVDVVEKPINPPNNFAQTGIYLYGPGVFFKIFDKIEKSPRGEYEISSINSHLLRNNFKVGHKEITGWWKDTGAPVDLIIANRLLMEEMSESEFKNLGQLNSGAQIDGKVKIGVGTTVGENVKIIGPAIIGENCTLKNCTISSGVTIGSGSVIEGVEITNSIVLANCHLACGLKIKDSIIGGNVQIKKKNTDGFHRLIVGEQTLIEL